MTTIELGAAPDELGLRLNTLAVGGLVVTGIRHTITIWNANTPTLVQASALTTALLTVAAAAANPDYTCEIRGLIRVGATGGPLNVEFASEVAVSAVTIQADASSWRRKSPDTDAPSSVPEHTSPPLSYGWVGAMCAALRQVEEGDSLSGTSRQSGGTHKVRDVEQPVDLIWVSERVNAKINQRHGLTALDVEDAVNRPLAATMSPNLEGVMRLLLVGTTSGGRKIKVVLYATEQVGTWNLATAFLVP